MLIFRLLPVLLLAASIGVDSCGAGPPFVSDDPQPTDAGHWEVYGFTGGTHVSGRIDGATGFDINYGGAKDLQLTAVVPLNYQTGWGGTAGIGNLEIAAKYKFLHQTDGSSLPDIAFFPRVFLPTAGCAFGSGRLSILLPLWAQKDIGKWSLFGGGGYDVNPGKGQRDFWLTGLGVQRALTDRLMLGGEIYRQTADADDARSFSAINFGLTYRLDPHWSLLAAAGPGIEHAQTQGHATFYMALKADY